MEPQNVLVSNKRNLRLKLSDMGISNLEDNSSLGDHATGCGSSGWQAAEQLHNGRQTSAADLFSLGCVLFFCITGGRHPFGDRLECDINIVNNKKDLFLVEFMPEAEDLISRLLNPDPKSRPKALEVLQHPMFWISERRLSFLCDTNARLRLEDRKADSTVLKALASTARTVFGCRWNRKMDPEFMSEICKYNKSYNFNSVRDLVRALRNKKIHYSELPQNIKGSQVFVTNGISHRSAMRTNRFMLRCTCSLDDLIQMNSNSPVGLKFWESNGHPSSFLLDLMRNIVSGLEFARTGYSS